MGKAYSDDLRRRVVAAMAMGRSCRQVVAAFDVAPSTAGNWWRRYRSESSYAARPTGGDRRSKLLDQAGWIGEWLAGTPELTLDEVRSEFADSNDRDQPFQHDGDQHSTMIAIRGDHRVVV